MRTDQAKTAAGLQPCYPAGTNALESDIVTSVLVLIDWGFRIVGLVPSDYIIGSDSELPRVLHQTSKRYTSGDHTRGEDP
jgi:hypothetical protein